MPFPPAIHAALENYDKNKGFWRRLFRRDQAAIRALRRLNETDQADFLKLYCCFIGNKPKDTQESYQVYRALLSYLASENCKGIPDTLDLLHSNQLLDSNLKELKPLSGDHFQKFAILLNNLNTQHLLTQLNFDNIVKHFEDSEDCKENILKMLSSMLISVDKLGSSLTQENLKCLLKNPLQAENMANILLLLDQNQILTSENCIQLCNEKNELLLENKAYYAIWYPLKACLSTIVNIHERQRIFDHLIHLTQNKENEIEIEKYVNNLISKPPRRYTFDKFSTAPSPRIKTRSMISDLNLARDRPGTL